jgi:hypothetical protein
MRRLLLLLAAAALAGTSYASPPAQHFPTPVHGMTSGTILRRAPVDVWVRPRQSATHPIRIYRPDPAVDYAIIRVTPDPSVDHRMRIIRP